MSRCFPFPPPNYHKECKPLAESIKLQKKQDATQERKKEKKREKTEKKEKSKGAHDSSKHREHGHKKRKHEESDKLPAADAFKAATKQVMEQLEKSGLTEEHGLPYTIPEPCESSESTQNSSKSRKLEANISGGNHGSTILRLRLPLQKHKDPKPTPIPVNEEPCFSGRSTPSNTRATLANEGQCFSGRATVRDPKVTLADEMPCFSRRVDSKPLKATSVREGSCFSGHTTPKDLRAIVSSDVPCIPRQATPKDLKVASASDGPCFSGRATPKDSRATLAHAGPCFSGRVLSRDVEVIPSNEAPLSFSGRTSEASLLQKLGESNHSRLIKGSKAAEVPMERVLSNNACSLSVENNRLSEAPLEWKSDENAHGRSSSSSNKGSKRTRKLEKKFSDLIVSWKPEPLLLLDAESGAEDLSWLLGSAGQRHVNSESASCSVVSTVEELSHGSSVHSFQPRACYMPEFEAYQLPYVVPF